MIRDTLIMTHGKPRTFGRYAFWGVIIVLVLAFLGWSFTPSAVPVDLGTISSGAMTVQVESEGRTRVNDIYVISAPVSGLLKRIRAKAGDAVIANQTRLAAIEPADPTILDRRSRAEAEATAQAAEDVLALALAEMDRARAELTFARTEHNRAQQLRQRGTISQRDLDVAELEVVTRAARLKSAEARAKVRQHELETARARLLTSIGDSANRECCVEIFAPVSGRVLRVVHESAGVVAAGTELLEIGNPSELEVVVDLLTSDSVRIREGAKVIIDTWGGPALTGTVRRIEPFGYTKVSVLGIEEQRVDVVIDFSDPENLPTSLGHGFRVETKIEQWRGDNVLRAPMSALFRVQDSWAVYVFDQGSARLARIDVGHMNDREAEVQSGLEDGDLVVLHPSDQISDGVRLSRREE